MADDVTDPMRLLASPDSTELERTLLRSWQGERPSADARDKTLAVLGLGGVGIAAAGGSIAPKAIAAGWLAIAKWMSLGVVAVTAAVGATYAIGHAHRAHVSGSPTQAPVIQTVLTPAKPAATQAAVIELPEATSRVLARPAPPVGSSLVQQVAAVDRARAALDAGDAARARRLVDSYEAEYPNGAVTQEAEVVRIEALVHEGNRVEADRVGKRFLSAYPKTPHAVRVRALLSYDP
jgi:TolA-binding protein